MIKNNKGFMLIEVIVTSTIVVTTMILLYSSFNRLSNNYKIRNSYYNLDATYATKEMINSMLKKEKGNINEFINTVIPNSTYGHIINNNKCVEEIDFRGDIGVKKINTVTVCPNLQKLYSIENMIFSEYNSEFLEDLKNNESINQTFKEYVEYLYNYYDIKNTEDDYSYIILTEVKKDNNYYYASLRMR